MWFRLTSGRAALAVIVEVAGTFSPCRVGHFGRRRSDARMVPIPFSIVFLGPSSVGNFVGAARRHTVHQPEPSFGGRCGVAISPAPIG